MSTHQKLLYASRFWNRVSFAFIFTFLFVTSVQSNSNLLNKSIRSIDENMTGTTIPGQRGTGRNGNKWVLDIAQISLVGSVCNVMANVLDCDNIVSEFELQSCYYVHFRTNALGKNINPLILHLCPSLTMVLALSKPRRLIRYYIKKPKQTKPNFWNWSLTVIYSFLSYPECPFFQGSAGIIVREELCWMEKFMRSFLLVDFHNSSSSLVNGIPTLMGY